MDESDRYKANRDRPTVAVIGAGISGAACAQRLASHGFPVTIFEKEMELGGRASIHQDQHGVYDHGGQYFIAREKRFLQQVNLWLDEGIVRNWPARVVSCLHGVVHQVEDDNVMYVGVPGMNAMARHLALGLDVRSDIIVSSVKRVNHKWKIIAGGKRETFDVLVSSAPAEQTGQLLQAFPAIGAWAVEWRGLI